MFSCSSEDTMNRRLHGATSHIQESHVIHFRPAQRNLAMAQKTLVRPAQGSTAFPRELKIDLKSTCREMAILTEM